MIKKLLSPLGFAALFILGASATAYSYSMPGIVAQPTGSNAGCITRSTIDNAVYNSCMGDVMVWAPLQSRTTGNFRFYATAPAGDSTSCNVYGRDFSNNAVFSLGSTTLSGNTQVGGTSWGAIGGTTTIFYQCTLHNGGRLQSMNSVQF